MSNAGTIGTAGVQGQGNYEPGAATAGTGQIDRPYRRIFTEDGNLDDANFAGTDIAHQCTLILTVGKAAASALKAGIPAELFNWYGIYAIVGDMPNVRISKMYQNDGFPANLVPDNIRQALGLQLGQTNFGRLRYGKVMLATGQNAFCLKVKALVVNLLHKYWPNLLRRQGFLQQLITPSVVVSDRRYPDLQPTVYYSLFDFERDFPSYDPERDVRQYKSLDSFPPAKIRQYFSQLESHLVEFEYEDHDDGEIELAFGKNIKRSRRRWLESSLRNQFFQQNLYYDDNNIQLSSISYKYLLIREYSLWCHQSTRCSIPSALDGLVPDQRKVLHACLNGYSDRRVSVLQLVGSVVQRVGSLCEDIDKKRKCDAIRDAVLRMAQDFVGKGNINLLLPYGQFGTRATNDSGNDQDMQTELSGVAKLLFRDEDCEILKYGPGGRSVEPLYYLPVIPLILINGADVFGYGWKTYVPPFHPVDIIHSLIDMLDGLPPRPMNPWFRNFKGKVESQSNVLVMKGSAMELDGHRVRITELPVGTWTHSYGKKVLHQMVQEGKILNYLDRHTDTTVDYMVWKPRQDEETNQLVEPVNNEQLLQEFRLVDSKTCDCTLYDEHGKLTSFSNVTDVLRRFYDVRLEGYESRRQHMIGLADNPEERDLLQDMSAEDLWRKDLYDLLQRPEVNLERHTIDSDSQQITTGASAEATMEVS